MRKFAITFCLAMLLVSAVLFSAAGKNKTDENVFEDVRTDIDIRAVCKSQAKDYADYLGCVIDLKTKIKEEENTIKKNDKYAFIPFRESKKIDLDIEEPEDIRWDFSDPGVFEITKDGVITSLKRGFSIVKAFDKENNEIFSCMINSDYFDIKVGR